MKAGFKYIFIIFFSILLFTGCIGSVSSSDAIIDKGKLDLTKWFVSNNSIKLDGEWEFYWKRFLTHEELDNNRSDQLVRVPSTWNSYYLSGSKLPGTGYATYRLRVKTDLPLGTKLGLRIHSFSSAYEIYINNSLIAKNGRLGTTAAEEIGEYRPQAVFFDTPGAEFDIIIHVSNFHYARGGFWYPIAMGSAEKILGLHESLIIKEAILLGALFIIILFCLAVFIISRKQRYILYFAFLAVSIAVAIDVLGQLIILKVLPGLSFNAVILIWYTSTTWLMFSLILLVHELYPSRFSRVVFRTYLVVSVLFQTLYLFATPDYYSSFAQVSNVIDIVGAACTVTIVAIGIKNGQKSGWLNIAGMFIALITYVHDILYLTNIINSRFGEIFYGGLLTFILIQIIIQAQRVYDFYEEKNASDLAFLQAQIKPHFLYNAINTFLVISHYDMDKARNLLADLGNYLRRSFDFKGSTQLVPLKDEIQLAKAYIAIEKARFEERLEVNFIVPDDLEVRVPSLILQPLIENAVVHGILPKPEGGCVEILVSKKQKKLVFCVKDNGIGMTGEKSNRTLNKDSGKGVGLANIDSRLRKLFGSGLQITSEPQLGTEIAWSIPIK